MTSITGFPSEVNISSHNQRTNSRHDELLSAALAYAEHGLRIAPGHEPLFDNDGKLTGCTCEAYKRSKKYFEWLRSKGLEKKFDPAFKCRTPGKHPRLSDWETQASNDPAQIKAWWQKWPTANICFPPGINGSVTFDLDSYKEVYGDDGALFTQADKDTVTQISGGGGEHLVFQMPAGKAYTNANNTLPPGIDIRGFGGQILVEPSLHPSGNLYQWELGYSILERTPKPLPAALEAILDAAHQNSTKATHATFTAVTTEKPDLIRWRMSKAIRELIHAPGVVGQRSENDMKACTALVYAGATPDDILAVFQHYPIGTQGKYAERGPEYLARTIGKAQAFVDAHPRPDIPATVDNILLWVRTKSFESFIDDKYKTLNQYGQLVYMTDTTDSKTADAVLCVMKDRKRLTINIGKKRLAMLAGFGSCNTALKALTRLNGWLFDVTIDPVHGAKIALDLSRLEQNDPSLASAIVYKRDHSATNDKNTPELNEYSPRKADEPFLIGTSKTIKERIQDIAKTLEIEPAQAKEEYTFAGLGESALRVIDAMLRAGDMTAQELASETGKKISSIRTAVRKLVQHGIVDATRESAITPYTYSLCADVWAKIDEVAPNLRTYGLVARRENKRLESAQQWVEREIKERTEESEAAQLVNDFDKKSLADSRKKVLEWRFEKLGAQRISHLKRLHPDLSDDDIRDLAYEVGEYRRSATPSPAARNYRNTQTAEHRNTVRMIRELAESFMDVDTPAEAIYSHIMQFGTFDENLVKAVLQSPRQMSKFETLADVRKRLEHDELMAGVRIVPAVNVQPTLMGGAA